MSAITFRLHESELHDAAHLARLELHAVERRQQVVVVHHADAVEPHVRRILVPRHAALRRRNRPRNRRRVHVATRRRRRRHRRRRIDDENSVFYVSAFWSMGISSSLM
jgi:hypothetical protein